MKKIPAVLFILIVVIVAGVLITKNKTNNESAKPANVAETTSADAENFFQKEGAEPTNNVPVAVPQTKTVDELEKTAQSQESSPTDYNALAVAYHKSGNQDNALKTIADGLVKYPNDKSLLLTKDLIENPNL